MATEQDIPGRGGFVEFQGAVRRDGKPFVITLIDGQPLGQLTPSEAQNMGIRAIAAAQEAERDAAIVVASRSVCETAEEAEEFAAGLLIMIRKHRGQVDPDPRSDHLPGSGDADAG